MLDHARETVDITTGRKRADLDSDRLLNLAVVRLLEIVGEAAARVGEETRSQLPEVPWPEVVGMRNRIIHGYDQIDFDIVWNIVELDLPSLVASLSRFVEQLDSR